MYAIRSYYEPAEAKPSTYLEDMQRIHDFDVARVAGELFTKPDYRFGERRDSDQIIPFTDMNAAADEQKVAERKLIDAMLKANLLAYLGKPVRQEFLRAGKEGRLGSQS